MPDDTDDQMNDAIEKVAKQIKTEINNIEADRKNYYSYIDRDICSVFQSNTFGDILSKVSQKLKQSLPALLIGNIVTSVIKKPSHTSANSFGCIPEGFQRTSQSVL